MKAIKFLLMSAMVFCLASCGGYSNEKAREYTKKLARAVEKDEPLMQDEYIEIAEYTYDSVLEMYNEYAPFKQEYNETEESDDKDKLRVLKKREKEIEKKYKRIFDLIFQVELLKYNTTHLEDETIEKIEELSDKCDEEAEKVFEKYDVEEFGIGMSAREVETSYEEVEAVCEEAPALPVSEFGADPYIYDVAPIAE